MRILWLLLVTVLVSYPAHAQQFLGMSSDFGPVTMEPEEPPLVPLSNTAQQGERLRFLGFGVGRNGCTFMPRSHGFEVTCPLSRARK